MRACRHKEVTGLITSSHMITSVHTEVTWRFNRVLIVCLLSKNKQLPLTVWSGLSGDMKQLVLFVAQKFSHLSSKQLRTTCSPGGYTGNNVFLSHREIKSLVTCFLDFFTFTVTKNLSNFTMLPFINISSCSDLINIPQGSRLAGYTGYTDYTGVHNFSI